MKSEIASITHSRFSFQILDFLFHRPIFTSSIFVSNAKIPKPSIARILKCLADEGIIHLAFPSKGRKPAIYLFPQLLKIIQSD